jgi:drug/metabolite transporter (DMT)-like permease
VAAGTVLVLGLNWPVMSWGLESIPPLWLTAWRLLGAGLGLAAVLAVARVLRPPPANDLPVVVSVAALRLALVYGLVFSALLLVPPGRSSMLVHTTGLWAAPLAVWLLGEWLTGRTVAGLVAGVVGIVLLMEPWTLAGREGDVAGYAMLLGAAIATAVANIHVRGHRWTTSPLRLMPWQLATAGALTVPVALALHGPPSLAWSPREIGVVAYQVVLASGFGVWGVLTLGRSLPAATAGAVWMAVPAVGVASSVLLVSEALTPAAVAGMVLVAAGVWLAVGRRSAGAGRGGASPAVSPVEGGR